jgi:hypothetical protein
MDKMEEEINAMLDSPPPPSEDMGGELVVEDAPAEPAPTIETAPQVQVEAPPAAVESETPPAAEAPVVDERDSTIAELRAEMARLALGQGAQPAPEAGPPTTPTPIQAAPASVEFVATEEDLNKILDSKENFNEFLRGFAEKIRTEAVAEAREASLVSLPPLVSNLADQTVSLRLAIKEFYTNNKDLLDYKSIVGFTANKIAAERPELSLDQLIEELGPEVRKILRLKDATLQAAPVAGQVAPSTPDPSSPGFVPSGGAARRTLAGAPNLTKMEKEILEMNESL